MALGQPAVGDRSLDARGEIEQAERVRDRRSRAADPLGDLSWVKPNSSMSWR